LEADIGPKVAFVPEADIGRDDNAGYAEPKKYFVIIPREASIGCVKCYLLTCAD